MTEKEVMRAKKQIIAISGFFALLILICILTCLILFLGFKYKHTFSQENWSENPDTRQYIVSDMLKRHDIIGMSETDIIKLLGSEDSTNTSFKLPKNRIFPDNSTLVYYLGIDYMDTEWLIISLTNGIATEYFFGIT